MRMRAVLTAVLATLLLAAITSSASARNLSISNQQIRLAFASIELAVEGFGRYECAFTLEGSFHTRTITKVANTLLGYITRVSTAACTSTTAILALPWHVRYVGFSGNLPNITLLTVRVSRFSFSFASAGFVCLAEPEIEFNLDREAGGRMREIRMTEVPAMPLRSGGGFGCWLTTGNFRAPNPATPTTSASP